MPNELLEVVTTVGLDRNLPACRRGLLLRNLLGEGHLQLVGRTAIVAQTDEERILDAHDRRDLAVKRVGVDERFEREGLHVLHRLGVGRPLRPGAIIFHLGHDVNERGLREDEIDRPGAFEDIHAVGRHDAYGQHVALLLLDGQIIQIRKGEGERRTLHHPGRDDSRNIREIVIAAVGGEQFGRRIVVEHPVVLQQTGSLGERDRDVALPGLGHGDGDVATLFPGHVEVVPFDKHVVGERRCGDEHLIAEVVFALLILLAAREYSRQEQAQCES